MSRRRYRHGHQMPHEQSRGCRQHAEDHTHPCGEPDGIHILYAAPAENPDDVARFAIPFCRDISAAASGENLEMLSRAEQRIGAACAVAGSVVLFIGTYLHPMQADPNRPLEAFAEYAADRFWIASHLIQLA